MAPTVALTTKAFVTKDEIRDALFVNSDEVDRTDEELDTVYRMINWVCEAIESRVNIPVIQRSITEYSDGGGEFVFLTSIPVVSVTSVTERGTLLVADTDYVFDQDLGAARRILAGSDPTIASTFKSGPKAVKVVYVAGYGTQTIVNGEVTAVIGVPEDLKLAAYIWLNHLWKNGPENFSAEQGHATGSRAAIPYQVKEVLISRPTGAHWIGMS